MYSTSVEERNDAIIALPEVLALVQSVLRSRPVLAVRVIGIHCEGMCRCIEKGSRVF